MRKDNRGMTLIELLVAITMLGVVISPFLKTFTMSARQNNKARETLRATTVAQNLMEGLEAFSLEDVCNQVNKNTGPNSMLYRPNGYAEHSEIGDEKSGNGLSGEEYVFQNTPSNKYEIGIKGIEEDGKKYDAKIFLDASGYATLNSNNDFEVSKLNENSDMVFFLSPDDEKKILGNDILWTKIRRRITIELDKNIVNANTEVKIKVTYVYNDGSTKAGKDITRTFSNLNAIYFMYYPNYVRSGVEDEFVVDYDSDDVFELFLVKQKYPTGISHGNDIDYCASLTIHDSNTDQVGRINLRTNIFEELYGSPQKYGTALTYEYKINNVVQTTDKAQSLLGFVNNWPKTLIGQTSNPNAIYKTTVQIFPEGTYPDKFNETEPIAQLEN